MKSRHVLPQRWCPAGMRGCPAMRHVRSKGMDAAIGRRDVPTPHHARSRSPVIEGEITVRQSIIATTIWGSHCAMVPNVSQ
jgi:hypothetical protein